MTSIFLNELYLHLVLSSDLVPEESQEGEHGWHGDIIPGWPSPHRHLQGPGRVNAAPASLGLP